MADDALAYALTAPDMGESITSQLQRELLAAETPTKAVAVQDQDDEARPRTRSSARKEKRSAEKAKTPTPTKKTRRKSDEHDEIAIATPEALVENGEKHVEEAETTASERRRTLSPSKAQALMGRATVTDDDISRRDTVSPQAMRKLLESMADGDDPIAKRLIMPQKDSENNNEVNEEQLSEILEDVSRTKEYVESSKQQLQSSSNGTLPLQDGEEQPSQGKDQDSFTDAFFSRTLMSREDDTMDGESRRATIEPTDAAAIFAELRSSDGEKATESNAKTRISPRRRDSKSPSKQRRTTLDPTDLLAMRDDVGASPKRSNSSESSRRRETIGDVELSELQREFGLKASSPSLKRKSPENKSSHGDKRTRLEEDKPKDVTPPKNGSADDDHTPPKTASVSEESPFFSPPATANHKTPLKSCLSARKAKRGSLDTTPSKSVNFGPPQGAEFNFGSPSTSMTPLPPRDAKAMFPLEEKKSEDTSEGEDEETSHNSSLLDEADSRDSDEDMDLEFENTLERNLYFGNGAMRNRRRYSLRGVSPLDNQANARRQRRLSAASNNRSPLVSARNRPKDLPKPNNSFLSASNVQPQSRLAYADSSASSDEGEDMEITGDYSHHASTATALHRGTPERATVPPKRSVQDVRRDSLLVDSPQSDHTIELGTLQDLVTESAAYDENKPKRTSEAEADAHDNELGSLGDLAREGEEDDKVTGSQTRRETLDPIQEEEDEDRRSSAQSMMSLDSTEESDNEYDEKRKSLVVNLSSKFERIGSATPKGSRRSPNKSSAKRTRQDSSPKKSPPRPPSPPKPVPVLLELEEILSRVSVPPVEPVVVEPFNVDSLNNETDDKLVGRKSFARGLTSVLRAHAGELASWSSGLADGLASLSKEKASAVFAEGQLQPAVLDLVRSLHTMESRSVRSGYCQWRTKFESRACDALTGCENTLQNDLNVLQARVADDQAQRDSEINAIKELIEREHQMAQLLDGIEEQQGVQREYASTVETLEGQCASLALQEKVLHQQYLDVDSASPSSSVNEVTEATLRQEVLKWEELLAVRENVVHWRVMSASASRFDLCARIEDVLFKGEVRCTIYLSEAGRSGRVASLRVQSAFHAKHQKSTSGHLSNDDAVCRIASQLLDQERWRSFSQSEVAVAMLQEVFSQLDATLSREFRFITGLREMSTTCALRYAIETNQLWMDFVRFPRQTSNGIIDGVKFCVGYEMVPEYPFVGEDVAVAIKYGKVTEEKIGQQVDAVTRDGHEYFQRVYRRLYDVFISE
ncbi:hypothetical protein Poli38472_005695 [Pythium oligandrum]|uniref:Uncharacterized protein n=1 Tax=Pythium oligandrum TaxID=41045 RepID=A0A8K1FKQ8_PYTOL|nr:hypothetical protein Poli38472_005695 [Pythium oligandrum]|eukprot:TMW63077.1 hypothetical protein Poli38472_005695 [Pythium oligandrum]